MESRLCLGSSVWDGSWSTWLFVRICLKHLQKPFPEPRGHQLQIFFHTEGWRKSQQTSPTPT